MNARLVICQRMETGSGGRAGIQISQLTTNIIPLKYKYYKIDTYTGSIVVVLYSECLLI